ncbi:MAG: hypothetical protein GY870_13785 [archaeon]|nr:hypothetical protein [archaeon]
MAGKEKTIAAAEVKIADLYGDYCRFLGNYVRKLRDLSKQLDILSREERSGITSVDVTHNKDKVSHIDEIIEKKEKYYDKLKDVAIQKKSLLIKRIEYADLSVIVAKYRKQIVGVGMKIEEAKNKMIPADKVAGTETKLKDLEREFERAKKDLMKKDEQLEKEREEVNVMWGALKGTINGDME